MLNTRLHCNWLMQHVCRSHAAWPVFSSTAYSKRARRQAQRYRCPPTRSNTATSIYSSGGKLQGRPASATASQFLQAVELAAISVAAACQAAVLITTALQQQQNSDSVQPHLQAVPEAVQPTLSTDCSDRSHLSQQQRQQVYLQQQESTSGLGQLASPAGGLGQLQSLALLLALMCGVALRQLQRPRLAALGVPSADAAARLVALEITTQQQAEQLMTAARQLDKLQARVRVATSDLKSPLRTAQGSASAAAAVAAKLAEQQAGLQQQIDGCQELLAALQGLAAKQFKVTTEALQQLQSSQSQLNSRTIKAVKELQQQQQQMQQTLQEQQRQMQAIEREAAALLLQQQPGHGSGDSIRISSNDSSSQGVSNHSSSYADSSSGITEVHPDPWISLPKQSKQLDNVP